MGTIENFQPYIVGIILGQIERENLNKSIFRILLKELTKKNLIFHVIIC